MAKHPRLAAIEKLNTAEAYFTDGAWLSAARYLREAADILEAAQLKINADLEAACERRP